MIGEVKRWQALALRLQLYSISGFAVSVIFLLPFKFGGSDP